MHRCVLSNHQPEIVQPNLRTNCTRYDSSLKLKNDENNVVDVTYGCVTAKAWGKTERIRKLLFQQEGAPKKWQMFYLDIPLVHE